MILVAHGSTVRYLESLNCRVKTAQGVLCCTKAVIGLRPLRRELHAPFRVFQSFALGVSQFKIRRAPVAEVNLNGEVMSRDSQPKGVRGQFDRTLLDTYTYLELL